MLMKGYSIIGYAYDADIHCVECTRQAYENKKLEKTNKGLDENNIPEYLEDSEGNPVHPIFVMDLENSEEHCGDCGEKLMD